MLILKNTWFRRFARREKITDEMLIEAVTNAENGLIDADLGGNVIKQRIARKGQGKSGGYRTIIIFKNGDKAFFMYGFAKKDRENIKKAEIEIFKQSAKELLVLSKEHIEKLIENKVMTEVKDG